MTTATQQAQIERADWIQLHDGRTGKVAWVSDDAAEVFALMDDRSGGRPTDLVELVTVGQIARVIKAR